MSSRGMLLSVVLYFICTLPSFIYGDLLWPTPTSIVYSPSYICVSIDTPNLQFSIVNGDSTDVLIDSIRRYSSLLQLTIPSVSPYNCSSLNSSPITFVTINITDASTVLTLNTSETYSLVIPTNGGIASPITLTADTVFGVLRGLETLSQLLDYDPMVPGWSLPSCTINDAPIFHHRGMLVDTARHFLPVPTLYAILDALTYNKFNVFHWHIVDDQSFPYVSMAFPSLSNQGAYGHPNPTFIASHTYSRSDVQNVLNYARLRGIRVIAEFDTPGHSLSWGSIPGLLTQCYNTTTNQPIPGSYGPIDPTNPSNYNFLTTLFAEVAETFPDTYIMIGGDEVSYTCWASNPNINTWMANHGISPGNYTALESYYVQNVLNIITNLGREYIGWEEIFDNGLTLSPNTVIDVWKYHNTGAGPNITWQSELYNVTKAGYHAILSSPWYLNYIAYGDDWTPYLTASPLDFGGNAEQQSLVLGGEFSLWGEYIDATNVLSRGFPRGSAVAQALWTCPGAAANITDATLRMQAHACRLLNRGIAAEPASGPSFCPQEWNIQYNPPWER